MGKSDVQAPAGLVYRGNRPYFRARIPQQLQAHFGNRREIKKSLGDITRERAKHEARRLAVEWEAKFAQVRQQIEARAALPPERLTPEERQRYCEAWLRHWLAEDEAQRRRGISSAEHEAGIEIGRDLLIEARERLARGDTRETAATLDDVFGALAMPLPASPSERHALAFDLLKFDVLLHELIARRDRGEIVETPLPEIPASVRAATPGGSIKQTHGSGQGLDALIDHWERTAAKSRKTVAAARLVSDSFKKLHGDLSLAAILRRHFTALRDAELAKGRSPATVKKNFALLRAAFNAAIADEVFGLTANPLDRLRVRLDGTLRKPRDAFTAEELQRLFAMPVFTKGERPGGGRGEAAFWLPLLALFTGARRGEIAQLRCADIETRDGVRCIAFRHDPVRGQSIKTGAQGRRFVPIHAELERLGFLRYVESLRARGVEWLFPELDHGAEDRAKAWGKWFNRYLDEAGLASKKHDFHSFRHTFKHCARACDIPEEHQDAITGHAGGSRVARRYGSSAGYPIRQLAAAMERFSIESIDLGPLRGFGA